MGFYDRVVAAASAATAPVPLTIDWFTAGFTVYTDAEDTRAYLASQHHVVGPPVVASGTAGRTRLYAVADADLLDEARARYAGQPHEDLEAFRGEWYARYETPDGGVALLTGTGYANPHLLVTPDFRSWAVVTARPGGLGLLVSRTVRELIREHLLARGALMFHAGAGVRPDGHGVFLAGASAAGKTSAAIRVARGGGHVVGTDRVFLVRHEGTWYAVGLPMSTRLGAGAVRALGLVDALLERSPIRSINPFNRDGSGIPVEAMVQAGLDKVWLSNAEIHELLGCGFVAGTRADSVVVLERADDAVPAVDVLDPAQALTALGAHLLAPDPDYRSHWLSADPRPDPVPADPRRLLAQCPVTRVRWDPTRHCDDRTTDLVSRDRRVPTIA